MAAKPDEGEKGAEKYLRQFSINADNVVVGRQNSWYMSQLLVLGKVESGGGPIFKVVLEC